MRPILVMVGIAVSLCAGCSAHEDSPAGGAVKPLPIIVLKYPSLPDKIISLNTSYGFLISWEEGAAPRFYVYDAPRRRINVTGDFAEFIRLLSAFPDGEKVGWMNGCAGGFCWAMPKEQRNEIEKLRAAKRLRYANDRDGFFTVCTCETKEVVFLEKAP